MGRASAHASGAAAVAATAVLSFAGIGHKSLWADEGFSWSTSHRSLGALARLSVTKETNGVLYAFVLKLWMGLFGTSEAAMRSLSAVCAVVAATLIYVLGCRLGAAALGSGPARLAGAAAALLFGLNGSVLTYAQNVRFYTMATAVACAAVLAFDREVRAPTRGSLRWWVAALCLLPLVHLMAVTLVPALLLALAARPASERRWRRRIGGAAVAAAVTLPVAALVASRDEGQSLIGFGPSTAVEVVKFLTGRSGPVGLVALLCLIAAGALELARGLLLRRPRASGAHAARASDAVEAADAAGAAGATGATDAVADPVPADPWAPALCLSWAVVPTVILFLASVVTPVLVGRYVLFTLPGFLLAGTLGIGAWLRTPRRRPVHARRSSALDGPPGPAHLAQPTRPTRTWLLAGTAAALTLGWANGAYAWHRDGNHDDWRAMAEHVFGTAQPGDGVLFANDSIQLFFSYYRERLGVGPDGPPVSEFPAGPWGRFRTGDQHYVRFGSTDVQLAESRHRRLWLVVERELVADSMPAPVADLLRRYAVREEQPYGSAGTLFLIERVS